MAGSAMQGGGAPLSGSLAQSLAYSLSRGRSSSGSQSQGGESGGQSKAPAATSKPYNPQDASKDSEVQQAIDQSKPADLHS
jgi:hypothetical protein